MINGVKPSGISWDKKTFFISIKGLYTNNILIIVIEGLKLRKTIAILSIILLILPAIPIHAEKEDTVFKENSLPSYFSWRDINGTDYTTPVKNQAPAPTCEAYGFMCST